MFTVLCRHAHSVIGTSDITKTWKYIIALDIKGKHNFKLFYYIHVHIVEISTNKRANSNKLKI